MHQHLADNQHAEPIGLLRGAGDEVQLLCTRLKKSEFHIIQSDAQLFPAEQRIEADAERFAQAGKLRRCDWQIDVDTAASRDGCKLVAILRTDQKQVVFGEALLRSVEDVVGLPAGNDKKFVVVVVVQRGVWGIPPMEGYPEAVCYCDNQRFA